MTDTVRSIRMNKEHRQDMLNAVMKQWVVANPAPAGATFESFIEAMLTELMKVPAKAPAHMRAFRMLCAKTQAAKIVMDTVPNDLKDVFNLQLKDSFQASVQLNNDKCGTTYFFRIPQALADKLNIPYFDCHRTNCNVSDYPTYQHPETNEVSFVRFVTNLSHNSLVIEHSSPALTAYKEGKRTLALWYNEKEKIAKEITDYLEQFNTTGQIRDNWPEMEQYLPAHIADPSRVIKLPALTRSRLNERLGIN